MKTSAQIHFPLFVELLGEHLYSGHPWSFSTLSLAGVPGMPLCSKGSTLNSEMGDDSHLK